MEREGMDNENDVANVLKYANELPNLQQYWENIQANNHNLKYQNQELEKELQRRRRNIAELTEVENMHQQNIDTLQNDIDRLFNERRQLQQFVYRFKNSNKKYLKIKSIAEEVVDILLAERKALLSSALVAVVEALRMNPDRYAIIYNSKYDDHNDNVFDSSKGTTVAALASSLSTSTSTSTTKPLQNHYYNEYHEGLLELAKGFLNSLLNQVVDKTMVAAVKGK
jgi:chromosome segregation ATPase